jgi:hypothetical protein
MSYLKATYDLKSVACACMQQSTMLCLQYLTSQVNIVFLFHFHFHFFSPSLKILKVTSVENTEKCFKTLTSRTKDGEKK